MEGELILNVDFFNNFADKYTVVVSADGYRDTGYFPVRVSPKSVRDLSQMLVPNEPVFAFAPWDIVVSDYPAIATFVSLTPDGAPKANYEAHVEDRPTETACLLNLDTAMSQIFLADGTPLDYFRSLVWNSLAQDRIFGYAIPELAAQVRAAVSRRLFVPELDPGFFHGDATSSFKERRFGEANVQLTFHEKDKKQCEGEACIRVEADIDYFKDVGAHAIFEVFFNHLTNSLTDPVQVYQLRWIAGKQAELPEFNPPFSLTE